MNNLTQPLPMCMEPYVRSQRLGSGIYATLYCHAPRHDDPTQPVVHTWAAIYDHDTLVLAERQRAEAEEEARAEEPVMPLGEDQDYVSPAAQAGVIVTKITAGDYDPYIEQILAAGHDRKRALRSVPGFPRKDRNRG